MTGESHRKHLARMGLCGAMLATIAGVAFAQEPADDLAHAATLLDDVRDNAFSFDDPAFYWFCRYVGSGRADAALSMAGGDEPLPWKMLIERPSDYRGKPVIIEGLLQTTHVIDVTNREGIGRLYQCELAEAGTRSLCAVICTQEPVDVPLRSRVRARGYFIKVRAYQTTAGDGGAGPLLVARNLQLVQAPVSGIPGGGPRSAIERWIVPAVAVLIGIWWVLRRATSKSRSPTFAKRASGEGGEETDDDFSWLSPDASGPPSDSEGSGPNPNSP